MLLSPGPGSDRQQWDKPEENACPPKLFQTMQFFAVQ